MKLDRIAVALDFSSCSLLALARARRLVRRGGTLLLVHVIDESVFRRGPSYGDRGVEERLYADLIRGARSQLDVHAEEVRVEGATVELSVRVGRPADEVLAASEGADLLCVGTHGRGPIGRFFLGSVAEEVARRSPRPTLVVREVEGEESVPTERVLVAVDPSGPSREAILAGADLAARLGARLEAIHAVHVAGVVPSAEKGALLKVTNVLADELDLTTHRVEALVRKTVGREVATHVVVGEPAQEIVRRAGPRDIVVCGTHSRSGIARLAFGSVAARLARTAPCPVLVVRPSSDEERESAQASASSSHPTGTAT